MPKTNPLRPRFVTVQPPQLIGPRGSLYYLNNKPMPVSGRRHVVLRRRRTPPQPLFRANPPIDWHPADATQRSPLWGQAAEAARSAVSELVQGTARQLNIKIVDDGVSHYSGAVVRRPPLNIIHVRDIGFVTSQIVAAARHYHEWSLAWADDLVVPRTSGRSITVAWQTYDARTTGRLRSLLRAAKRGTQARLELQWYQAPSAMRYCISRAAAEWPSAERRALLAQAIVPGDMISAPIPTRKYLRAVLPEAIRLASRQRGRRIVAADIFLGLVREMFLMIAGNGDDQLRVGRFEVPNGAGADFVRGIEQIFDVRLLNEASLHTVDRVRDLKLPATTASGPYFKSSVRIV
jgi:hypothetical protein